MASRRAASYARLDHRPRRVAGVASLDKWDDYTAAEETMFQHTEVLGREAPLPDQIKRVSRETGPPARRTETENHRLTR